MPTARGLLEEFPNKTLSLLGILVDVNLRSVGGGEYLEIVVDRYPNPISYKGVIYYRSGSTNQALRGAALSVSWKSARRPATLCQDGNCRRLVTVYG